MFASWLTSDSQSKERGAGIPARFAGVCPGCGDTFDRGDRIDRFGEGWMHAECASAKKATQQILAGETFRSQRGTDWRVGRSPG